MEGFPPSSIEEDVNMISDELDLHSLLSELELHSYVILKHILSEDDCLQFSYSSVYPIIDKKQYNVVTVHESRPPPEVPVNQSSISCNDQGGQNKVINDSIQQTTPFPTSFPETMMEGFQPSFMEEVDNMTLDQLGFQSEEDTFNMSELLSYVILKHILPEDDCLQFCYSSVYPIIAKKQYNVVTFHGSRPPSEVPVNQSSISCNDQGGQNNVMNDSIQQTTPFPTSFPETMMEGFQPSFMEEVDNMTLDQLGFQSEEDTFNMSELLSYVILKHILPEDDCLQFCYSSVYPIIAKKQYNVVTVLGSRPPPEVPVNQSSISCNDQGGQNNVMNDSIQQTTPFPTSFPETMTGHGYMTPNATTSQHGEFNQPGPSSPAPWYQPNPNLFDPQCANPLREQQWTDYQLPMSNQVPAMLPGPQPAMNQWHQYSNIHQPQPGHGYMTPNATTSGHGGFIQPGPSFPPPRSNYFSNQGQVDRAAVIPNIDNVQQENFVPRSQMDNLQVRGLQNQTAMPNASNPGPDTSLQSQIRGLNTQQVRSLTELS
ncbi:hypothetical protein POTOM_058887 [Populus tomentosa]|uniref:Uncharacterized protein n=1 Tax=Populus tomentosa TaxID=118781 RepID=A0A8X7XS11_POPTO|nr:hypothetical protein POTOM_058887 [Populus tomentosa]